MIVALPFCERDTDQVTRLLEWIIQLGGCPNHDAVLVADAAVQWSDVLDVVSLANKAFRSATGTTNDEPVDGWIPGSNSLWKAAAMHCQTLKEPWLFLEPDAVPLRTGWLDEIQAEYQRSGRAFLGSVVPNNMVDPPKPYLEGVAVYPTNAWNRLSPLFKMEESWTLSCSAITGDWRFNSKL